MAASPKRTPWLVARTQSTGAAASVKARKTAFPGLVERGDLARLRGDERPARVAFDRRDPALEEGRGRASRPGSSRR